MKTILFTKLFGERPSAEVIRAAAELGFDGIDLLIRPGATLEPDRPDDIGAFVRQAAAHGLSVDLATTDLTDPAQFPAEAVLAACAAAGITLVRLGYWHYTGSSPYREVFDEARRDLDRLATLAERFGVRLAIQLHGGTIHSSGALTSRLLDGRDPALFGAYPDPGNQAVQDGREDWRLTFDLLRPWLCCVGVKNGGWSPTVRSQHGSQDWVSQWQGLADGMVPWPDILTDLAHDGAAGPLTLHSHYEFPYEQVLDQTRTDLRFVRRILEQAAA